MAADEDDLIAVIGLAGRFPGAPDAAAYWANLVAGEVSLSRLTDEGLRRAGLPESSILDPSYVKYAPLLEHAGDFDARLFGFTRREAELRDPQQRIFLEVAYAALEDAGVDPRRTASSIGVFAGGVTNRYADLNVRRNAKAVRTYGEIGIQAGNHNDYISTIVAYKLDLRGPAFTVATACSTSLLAVHIACQTLRSGECDVALAGGVQLEMPYGAGHRWVKGGLYSRDGRCRPFDADADGTIFGSGAGAVVLKPLADARRDGDRVLAVIRGSAVNNDGNRKAGFTAPSVEGQFAAVFEALTVSGVDPAHIGYVEGHGTGTAIGDPIEVQALTRAYREFTDRRGYSLLSSVKGNVGHLGPASGVTGLIKAVLAVDKGLIPGTANFSTANPLMEIATTPFEITADTVSWPVSGPRYAGVSSFGIGGTNVHMIIEGPPAAERATSSRPALVLPLAAASPVSLAESARRISEHLDTSGDDGADVAHTLRRRPLHHTHRLAAVGDDPAEMAEALADLAERQAEAPSKAGPLVFVFPGQGAQHARMAAELYTCEPVFREAFEECLTSFGEPVAEALRACLLSADPDAEALATERLRATNLTQPALFAVEWALTRLWASWGVRPEALIGHSIGEIVAATVAGVFDLTSAARLVVRRGELLARTPHGRMIATSMSRAQAERFLAHHPEVWISAENGPRACVLSGASEAVAKAVDELSARGQRTVELQVDRAFHTPLTQDAADELVGFVATLHLTRPAIPWVSNVTGRWISDEDAADPSYWGRQMRMPVRFSDAVEAAAELGQPLLLEVGPGQLTPLVRRQVTGSRGGQAVASLPTGKETGGALKTLYRAVANLWQAGVDVDWAQLTRDERRPGVTVPGYVFDRQTYWIHPDLEAERGVHDTAPAAHTDEAEGGSADDRVTVPTWVEAPPLARGSDAVAGRDWLVLSPEDVPRFTERLRAEGAARVTVEGLDGRSPGGLPAAVRECLRDSTEPLEILHLWAFGARPGGLSDAQAAEHWLERGYRPLRRLLLEIGRHATKDRPIRVTSVVSGLWDVSGADSEGVEPGKAPIAALLDVAVKEHEALRTRVLDLAPGSPGELDRALAARFWPEIVDDHGTGAVRCAVRGHRRWTPSFRPVPEDLVHAAVPAVAAGDVWVITGGLGALGLVTAERLARRGPVTLALLGRGGLLDRATWSRPDALDAGTRRAIEAVLRMEELGSTVLPLAVDVTDRDRLCAALDRVREEFGPVTGVVHAAGVAGSGMLAVKDPAEAEKVLRPKILGALLLDELLGDEPETFVLYSSVAAVTGQFGLADYAAANAFLDAFAHDRDRRRPGRTISVNWPSWSGGGMAVDAAASRSPFLREADDQRRNEPVIVPLPDGPEGERSFRVRLTPACWIVDEHRLGDTPVLPGTGHLELVLRAARTFLPLPVELTDVTFTAPVAVPHTVELTVTFSPESVAEGTAWRFRTERVGGGDGGRRIAHTQGRVSVADDGAPPRHDLTALRAAHTEPLASPRFNDGWGLMTVGPRWLNVTGVRGDGRTALAEIRLPAEFREDCAVNLLHPAMLDCATAFAVPLPGESNALPFTHRRLVVRGPLPDQITALIRVRSDSPKGVHLRDVAILDEEGDEVVTVEGFALREVERSIATRAVRNAVTTAVPKQPPADGGTEGDGTFLDTSAGGRLFEAFTGAVLGPQVIVAPEGLARKLRRTHSLTISSVRQSALSRPAQPAAQAPSPASTDPAAPTVDANVRLLWVEILGSSGAPDDDFFETGGDSLAAVQLVERVREELGVELPISALFDHPTLTEFSTAVDEARNSA
ncbi:SDR family NAD(P)-dependent oxidoreductase [Streptomyces sp. NPDC000405]|uniref:SDR family NAD(P)-dependent oxidoreductase n=1 Tax=Streptomyces sp. NPDC000405 TaxID=3161033 RepID=UPI00398CCAC7